MTILESLRSLSGYPIPTITIEDIADSAGLCYTNELTQELRNSADYKRAKANVYLWLACAPNVSQNGISYNFTADERKRFKTNAESILREVDKDNLSVNYFGYKGEDL